MILHKRRDVLIREHGWEINIPTLWSSPLSLSFLSSTLPPKSLVWRRQFKENRNANRRPPQSNIQTLRHPRRSASKSLKRRRRVSPLADENHHQGELVVAAVAAAVVVVVVMTVVMTAKVVVVVRLVRGRQGNVCDVLLFK
jgi:hypothetical protein